MNSISSLIQDIEIRYYWAMSHIVQSQRRNSSKKKIAYLNSISSDGYSIIEKQDHKGFNSL